MNIPYTKSKNDAMFVDQILSNPSVCWISHGFPMDFPWISHGFPMDFWISHMAFPGRFAAMRHGEVIANLGESSQAMG